MKWIALLFVTLIAYGNPPHICLSVTIENDEQKILSCLKSAIHLVDCLSISDLGSTDTTRELIEFYANKHSIPLSFSKGERSSPDRRKGAFSAAQEAIRKFGFSENDSYVFFLEPNQIVGENSTIPRNQLSEDSFLVLEESKTLSYSSYSPNLFRASNPLRSAPYRKLRSLKIEELSSESIDKRPLLHIAQGLKSRKEYTDAIDYYKKQIEKGGEVEEIWFAKYMLGECYEEMDHWPDALSSYLEAYQLDPRRGEPLRKIAGYYRFHNGNDLAHLFAKHGLTIPPSENLHLFPIPPLYDYQYDEELSIASYYTRFKNEGYDAANRLLLRKSTPSSVKDQAYRNILFYTENLKGTFKRIEIPLPPILGDEKNSYYPMNPSILKTENGYTLICRAVNYTQVGAKHFYTADPDWKFRTKNFLVTYDEGFSPLSQNEILENLPREKFNDFSVVGLEDCRIFESGNEYWFTCTTFDTNPYGAIQISLAKVGSDGTVEKLIPLKGPDPYRCEKNWLPFTLDGNLYVVYHSDPFTLYRPNLTTGECETILQYTPEHDFSRFRGSAAPIPFDDGYLMLVHEVALLENSSRVYLNRFVYLDQIFSIQKVSKPFTFRHQGVEICLSMTIDHSGKNLILPIGIEDREAWIMTVDLNEVRSMLGPLPTLYPPYL